MNKAIIFGAGVALGGGIGTGITTIVVTRRLNAQKDDEIEEVRAYYKKKLAKYKAKSEEKEPEKDENEPENEEKDNKKAERLSQKVGLGERDTVSAGRKKVNREHVDYTQFSKITQNYTGGAESLFQYPHEIDEAEFDGDPDFKKVILTWYENDDILADINDRPSEYTVEDFGYENFSDFGQEGIKYLRNEKTQTDFKVIYEGALSYDEATGGANLNDP